MFGKLATQRFRTTRMMVFLAAWLLCHLGRADYRIGDICRVKGQEENTLQGMGIVAGLGGTGDGDSRPTQRALARMMELMGSRIGAGAQGQALLEELRNAKNVALVFVTAIVPPGGAQPGDQVDCVVSAVSAKSLEGGYLMITALKGPNPNDPTIYSTAQGLLNVEDNLFPQTAKVERGATIEREFRNEFVKDNKITLVLNKDNASFETAAEIERLINDLPDFRSRASSERGIARARGQDRVEVEIPEIYRDQPEYFISLVLENRMSPPISSNKVIINRRIKAVIVGADVEIAPVAVLHKNRVIQTGDLAGGIGAAGEFIKLDPREADQGANTKLRALVDALNALQTPAEDVIDIIMMLKQKQAISGQLIIQ